MRPERISLHRYQRGALVMDYLRAAAGAAICLVPLALVEAATVMVYILGILGAIFLVYGLRTLLRHLTAVELSPDGIRMTGPWRRHMAWQQLSGMKLAFFSTRRLRDADRRKGWMEMKLTGGGARMKLDEALEGFDEVVGAVLWAADANDVPLSDVTRYNLDAMGFARSPGALPDDHL